MAVDMFLTVIRSNHLDQQGQPHGTDKSLAAAHAGNVLVQVARSRCVRDGVTVGSLLLGWVSLGATPMATPTCVAPTANPSHRDPNQR